MLQYFGEAKAKASLQSHPVKRNTLLCKPVQGDFSWLRKLFWEMSNASIWVDQTSFEATKVEIDSTAEIYMESRGDESKRKKHVELKYHHVKDLFQSGVI